MINEKCFPCKSANQITGTNQQASLDYNLASGTQFELELDSDNETSQAFNQGTPQDP